MERTELSLRDKWNIVKRSNINIGLPGGEQRMEQKQYVNTKENVYFVIFNLNALDIVKVKLNNHV